MTLELEEANMASPFFFRAAPLRIVSFCFSEGIDSFVMVMFERNLDGANQKRKKLG